MPPTEASPTAGLTPADAPPPAAVGVCANCGATLYGEYCVRCGQRAADFHASVWRLASEFLDNVFAWDSKFLRTVGPLLTRPGRLTLEFMAGRRARYVQPLRLFLFVSAVCLTLLQFNQRSTFAIYIQPNTRASGGYRLDIGNSLEPVAQPALSTVPGTAEKPDPHSLEGRFDRRLEERINAVGLQRLNHQIAGGIMQRFSWIALVLLPGLALGLRVLYWRRQVFYFTHLIFSLHFHAFLLLFWTVFAGWASTVANVGFLHWLQRLNPLWWLLPVIYLFAALRRVYGGGGFLTAAKVLLLVAVYMAVLTAGLVVVGVLAIFTTSV